ncbi:MAG: MoaD/ThiS family protein [Halobacteria archaeon]|nr:MoaD/ThiS family protein [Halobacteria archaeon]
MHIQVLLFASLRERFGQGALELDLITATSVGDLWQQLSGSYQRLPQRVLCAVSQQFADHEVMLRDGDEVAFFPPVTGG